MCANTEADTIRLCKKYTDIEREAEEGCLELAVERFETLENSRDGG